MSVSHEPRTNSKGYCEPRGALPRKFEEDTEKYIFGNGHFCKTVSYRSLFLLKNMKEIAQGIDCRNSKCKYSGIIQISRKGNVTAEGNACMQVRYCLFL